MNDQIDLLEFQKLTGNLKWLPMVAAAFLRQLPQWRIDLDAAIAAQDRGRQIDLLHKLKGSCQAVSASRIVEEITRAEAVRVLGEPLVPPRLLRHLESVEVQLGEIVANADSR
jgi:HPt (histidine-containing phosphotransfer) domain-containing protein